MITGIGTDLVLTSRIKGIAIRNPLFLNKVFTPFEKSYCQSKRNPWPHFAARFAAKEAFVKAYGHLIQPLEVEVSLAKDRRPRLKFRGRIFKKAHLSLTHDGDSAMAVVVLEKS